MEETRLYKGIDILKFLMAFVVVSIHTTKGGFWGIKEMAVPFFFMASGFFLFSKLNGRYAKDADAYMLKWLKRVLLMYIVWTAVYLPFTVIGFIQDGTSFHKSIAIFFRNFFFVGENYLSWPLWYLLGMIWAGCIIFILRKLKLPVWAILLIGIALALIARIVNLDQNSLYHSIFKSTRNGIFVGLPFMAAGGVVSCFDVRKVKCYLWLLLSVSLMIAMQFVQELMPLAVVCLFIFSVSVIDIKFISEQGSKDLRTSSTVIYLTHMIFAGIMILCGMEKGWTLFVATAVCIILFLAVLKKCNILKSLLKAI